MMDVPPSENSLTHARVTTRRRPSIIWLVPVVTVLIAAWLVWDTLSKRGPLITVTFENGEGLVAGQSQVKHKDVSMGTVQSVVLAPSLDHVIVTARMNPEAVPLLTDKAKLWVVKPRLFAGSVSGLDTVLSGSYIDLLPSGEAGQAKRDFVGLEDPPVIPSSKDGHTFLLKADRLGSIGLGAPVFYRGLTVGEVLGWDIADMAESVTIHAFVRAPYDRYVHQETHFWDASGVSLQLGAGGVRLQFESLKALLLGGVAFDSAPNPQTPTVTAQDAVFPLYPDQATADAAGFRRRVELVAYFPGEVEGLAKGSPVKIQGIQVGEVTSVALEYDRASDSLRVPVHMQIEPGRIQTPDDVTQRGPLENIKRMVARGMRAQLQSANLVTGQKEISFTDVPNAPPAEIRVEDKYIVVPTSPDEFGGIIASANVLVDKLSKMPFDQIGAHLNETLAGLNDTVNGPGMKQTMASLQRAMTSADQVMTELAAGAGPAMKRLPEVSAEIQGAATQLNRVLASVENGYGDNSKVYRDLDRLLVQLNDTAQAIRVLSDVLSRHPEAVVRGRPDVDISK